MDHHIDLLVRRLQERSDHIGDSGHSRFLVGISGIPASGKSTLAQHIVDRLNSGCSPGEEPAILVNLDGWHLTRAELDAMPDPSEAHARRGAHWTFNGDGYLSFVRSLRDPTVTGTINFPTFSHSVKDPEPSPFPVLPSHRIVIIEGLYACLGLPSSPWLAAAQLLDERWFIRIDPEIAKKRLVKRHVLTGITETEDEALGRAEKNDLPNGQFIIENMLKPTLEIESIDDFGGTEIYN